MNEARLDQQGLSVTEVKNGVLSEIPQDSRIVIARASSRDIIVLAFFELVSHCVAYNSVVGLEFEAGLR